MGGVGVGGLPSQVGDMGFVGAGVDAQFDGGDSDGEGSLGLAGSPHAPLSASLIRYTLTCTLIMFRTPLSLPTDRAVNEKSWRFYWQIAP